MDQWNYRGSLAACCGRGHRFKSCIAHLKMQVSGWFRDHRSQRLDRLRAPRGQDSGATVAGHRRTEQDGPARQWASRSCRGGSWAKECLDGAALVHGPVALGGPFAGQLEVEDFAGVDGAIPDQVDELGQVDLAPPWDRESSSTGHELRSVTGARRRRWSSVRDGAPRGSRNRASARNVVRRADGIRRPGARRRWRPRPASRQGPARGHRALR